MRALLLLALLAGCARDAGTGGGDLRVATFNIEQFRGAPTTDTGRLVNLLHGLHADIIAVQEIVEPARFRRVVDALAAQSGRRYRLILSACGGRSAMHVGFVYDEARVRFAGAREYPQLDPDEDGQCHEGERPGFLGRFTAAGRPVELLALHLAAGGDPDKQARRRMQWERALEIVSRRRAAGVPAVAVLGDVNSTGFLDDRGGERSWLEDRLGAAGLRLVTRRLPCSEYYHPEDSRRWIPSLLDHVAVTRAFPVADEATVEGYCRLTACRELDHAPPDYDTISDHCPVVVGARPSPRWLDINILPLRR